MVRLKFFARLKKFVKHLFFTITSKLCETRLKKRVRPSKFGKYKKKFSRLSFLGFWA